MSTRDPGLQLERTSAAWTRTGAALVCNALLLTRSSLYPGNLGLLLVSLAIGLGCIALFVVRARERKLPKADGFALPLVEVRIAALLTVVASAVAAVSMLA